MAQSSKQALRVGGFVLLLLIALGATLFVLSGSTQLFEKRYTIYAAWQDVAGLKKGATVRLSGQDVGEVVAIRFDEKERRLIATLSIKQKYQTFIRKCDTPAEQQEESILLSSSSEARIDTVGVLGDKFVSINMGQSNCTQIADKEWIETQESIDIIAYTKKITSIVNQLNSIGAKVDIMLGTTKEAHRTRNSLVNSFENLEDITVAIKQGNGLINSLIYKEELADDIEQSIRSLRKGLRTLDKSSQNMSSIINEVKNGDGFANELVYGGGGKEMLKKIDTLASGIASDLEKFRKSDSLGYQLLFDPERTAILDDLKSATAAIKQATTDLNNGNGTAALFLRDPTLYEDLRSLLGGAQRNKLLRAYIRRTVSEAEKKNSDAWEAEE